MPKGKPGTHDETARQYKQRKRKELRDVVFAFRKFSDDGDPGPEGFDLPGSGYVIGIRDMLNDLQSELADKVWGR